MIIDFHTHVFPDKIANKAINILSEKAGIINYTDGTISGLLKSMKDANIDVSVILPVATKIDQVSIINNNSIEYNKNISNNSLIYFGAMHPDFINYENELKRLKENGMKGVKLHPQYQKTFIDDPKYINIINKCFELGLIVVVHAGIDIGDNSIVKADPKRIRTMWDKLSIKGSLVLAHLGGWKMWDDVERYIIGSDMYLDTSFSLKSVISKGKLLNLLSKEEFSRLLDKHDSSKILFGTDSPWTSQRLSVEIIDEFVQNEEVKSKILYKNACNLIFAENND